MNKIILLYFLILPLSVFALLDEPAPSYIDTYSPSDLYADPSVGGGPQPGIYSNPPAPTYSIYSNPPAPTYSVFSNPPAPTYSIFSGGAGGTGGTGSNSVTISNPLSGVADDLPGLISYLLRIARILASAIAVLIIIYGGYQILFAAGDPRQFQIGVKTIIYALVGLAVILLGDIIVSILREITSF